MMRRLACLLWGWTLLGMASSGAAQQELFVAAEAEAGGDGSAARPFRTADEARDAIRVRRAAGTLSPQAGVTVTFAPGVYPLAASWDLAAEDGGSAEAPIVYRAGQPGTVRFQGGVRLAPESFQKLEDAALLRRLDPAVRDQVRVCDVRRAAADGFPQFQPSFRGPPAPPWLYVDHRPMTLARWPNAGAGDASWARFSKAVDTGLPDPQASDPARRALHPGSFSFDDPRPARWQLDEGVWLLGYWTHDWSDEVIRVASYDAESKVVELAAPHVYGINAGTWGAAERRFFAINALEELDAPGEWYLDRATARLYFIPESDLAGAEIVLATLADPLVRIRGTRHLQLVGLVFETSHGDGIDARGAEHVRIAGCTVARLAGSGITIEGTANSVRSCDIFQIGRTGIALEGGDRATLTPAGNEAVNNDIQDFGMFQRTYAPGIHAGGCGQIVRNNHIHDAPHNAVLYGGNEHLFERNEIDHVVMETGDAGAFYSGRDWTSRGNVLRQNYIHHLGSGDAGHVNTMGIYLDDCDCGDTLEGNVFYRAGRAIMIGGGRDNPVLNNLVIDCPIGLHLDARGMTWSQWNNPAEPSWHLEAKAELLQYTRPPWSTRYPRLAAILNEDPRQPLGNVVRRNVFVDCSRQVCSFDAQVLKLLERLEFSDNLVVSSEGASREGAPAAEIPGFSLRAGTDSAPIPSPFAGAATREFSAAWQAWLQRELPSFEAIPLTEIGLFRDEYRR